MSDYHSRMQILASRFVRPGKMVAVAVVVLAVLATAACSGGSSKSPGVATLEPPKGSTNTATQERKSWAGTQPAPEFPGGMSWFNVPISPTLAALKGKIVLLDFWTLGCINCQHIIPDLKKLEEEFGDKLVVIGVHSGKYATEHDDDSVLEAIQKYGLTHAVVNDPDFAVWQAYGANAWPTLVLIDPAGNLVGGHAGEGVYELFDPILKSLSEEFADRITTEHFVTTPDASTTSTVLSFPSKVLADAKGGRLFIADAGHNRILEASLDGTLKRAIGSGEEGLDDGGPNDATFRQPQGVALVDDGKTLYVADTRNHAIRAVDLASGEVSTIAGTGTQLDALPKANASAATTALASPWDVLARGNTLYIAMAGVHQIWTMDLDKGTIAVFAGTSREGIDDGDPRSEATLAQPSGLTADDRYLYWVDPESSSVRRTPLGGGGRVETLVGVGLFDYGNEDGKPDVARLQHAQGITIDGDTLYIGDTYNHELRTVDRASWVTGTAAGTGERGWADGPGGAAEFDEPGGLSVANGKIYIADTNNHLIRIYNEATKDVSTLELGNVAIAAVRSGAAARVLQVTLPEQSVTPGATMLR
ncbi:hypothetical protein AYO38_06140, partial [bacterium SCGC AG-212-C10]